MQNVLIFPMATNIGLQENSKRSVFLNRETYIRLMDWGNADQKRIRGIYLLNQLVTYIIYIAYPALALYLFMERDKRLWKIVLVPGVSFLLVSVFRAVYDEKRPYVAFDYKPVIQKEKKGKSMPSRHVFSAMILSAAFFYIVPASGIFMFVCALMLGGYSYGVGWIFV